MKFITVSSVMGSTCLLTSKQHHFQLKQKERKSDKSATSDYHHFPLTNYTSLNHPCTMER